MHVTITADERAAILEHLANLTDDSIAWLAWEKQGHATLDHYPAPVAVLEVALRLADAVVASSLPRADEDAVAASNAREYGHSAKRLRAMIAQTRGISRVEEGREHHEDGTVVINYTDGTFDEYPPSCRSLVPV